MMNLRVVLAATKHLYLYLKKIFTKEHILRVAHKTKATLY